MTIKVKFRNKDGKRTRLKTYHHIDAIISPLGKDHYVLIHGYTGKSVVISKRDMADDLKIAQSNYATL